MKLSRVTFQENKTVFCFGMNRAQLTAEAGYELNVTPLGVVAKELATGRTEWISLYRCESGVVLDEPASAAPAKGGKAA